MRHHVSDEDRVKVGALLERALEEAREQLSKEGADDHDAHMFTRALDSLLAWESADQRMAHSEESLRCDAEERVVANKSVARVLSTLEQRRTRWCTYASGALASGDCDTGEAADYADLMLEYEDNRFGP